MQRRLVCAGGAGLVLGLLPGRVRALESPAAPAIAATVGIDNFTFAPPLLTVVRGVKVTWTNHDDIPHTIVAPHPEHPIRSAVLDTDDSFSWVFAVAGRYAYFCSLHPHMQGVVVVT